MIPRNMQLHQLHYGWIIVLTGTLCTIAGLGFGRFALGMLLPSMAVTLKLDYSQMGFISTGNFIGYLASVFLSGYIIARLGQRKLIFITLSLVGLSMVLVSRATSFQQVLLLYIITGIGSGGANISMMSLVSPWFTTANRGKAAGFMTIGSGFAIIFAGMFIPLVNRQYGSEGWRGSWLFLGTLVIFIATACLLLLRNKPADVGLKPYGDDESPAVPHQGAAGRNVKMHKNRFVYHLGAIYFLFGYTYVIYATFIVTALVKERGFSETLAGNFWAWIGFLSLFSGPVFGTIADKLSRRTGMMLAFTFHCLSYLLVASRLPGSFLYLSIFFYGVVAWSIPTIMAASIGDFVGPEDIAKAFGFITFIFGLGQITGPSLAGLLAQKSGSFSSSFYMAASFAFAAIILSAFLKKPGMTENIL